MDFLKLVAFDQDDLKILAAHVQDALIKVGDLEYLARQKRFAIPMNRFAWEKVERKIFRRPRYRRHQSVLDFGRILSVRSRGIDRAKPSEVLSLLTLHFVKKEPPSGTIELVFPAMPLCCSMWNASRPGLPTQVRRGKPPPCPATTIEEGL